MTWIKSPGACLCGSCNHEIAEGDPVLLVTAAKLRRCQACAKSGFDTEPPSAWPEEEVAPLVIPKAPEFVTPRSFAAKARETIDTRVLRLAASDR